MPLTTKKKVVNQSNTHKMGEIIETMIDEDDKQNYEELIFSRSVAKHPKNAVKA